MSQLVINNTTICQGNADPSLAGRNPPETKLVQLRPSPTNPDDAAGARKYSDNNVPYIGIYQNFTLPITFQPTRIIPGTTPPKLESIVSISCRLKECKVESPLLTDSFSIVEPDTNNPGKVKLSLPKFDPNRLLYHKEGQFFEPKILGDGKSVCAGPILKSYSPVPGQSQIYTLSGYYTERNFFDREWIVQWDFLIYKINANGVYWNCPLLDQLIGSMIGINKANWIHSSSWTPNEFYQLTKEQAKRYDSTTTQKYVKGARKIIQYKPSEIGSLRFYYEFKCTTDYPGESTETFEATMSVKYNTQFGADRLKVAQKKEGSSTTSTPEGEEQKGAATQQQAQATQTAAANNALDDEFTQVMALPPEEVKKSLTLY